MGSSIEIALITGIVGREEQSNRETQDRLTHLPVILGILSIPENSEKLAERARVRASGSTATSAPA
jgi:hypothetical protein